MKFRHFVSPLPRQKRHGRVQRNYQR